jgi:hypothetical protein
MLGRQLKYCLRESHQAPGVCSGQDRALVVFSTRSSVVYVNDLPFGGCVPSALRVFPNLAHNFTCRVSLVVVNVVCSRRTPSSVCELSDNI